MFFGVFFADAAFKVSKLHVTILMAYSITNSCETVEETSYCNPFTPLPSNAGLMKDTDQKLEEEAPPL